jgi:hypothetical protein
MHLLGDGKRERNDPLELAPMREAVRIWTTARMAAAVANQALNAIGDEKTVVTASRYALVASVGGPSRPWLASAGAYALRSGLSAIRPWVE